MGGVTSSLYKVKYPETTELQFLKDEKRKTRNLNLTLLIIALSGFVFMFLRALWKNAFIVHTMREPIGNPCVETNNTLNCSLAVKISILGNRINGVNLALATEYNYLSGFLGYTNPYTPSLTAALIKLYGIGVAQAIDAIYYLESGLVAEPQNATQWTDLFDTLVYGVVGVDVTTVVTPIKSPNGFDQFMKYGFPFLNFFLMFLAFIPK